MIAQTGWQIDIHHDIAPLEAEWRALEARGACTLFQCFDWARIWYDINGRHKAAEPLIVTARRAGSGRVDAILPLCVTQKRFHREITFADLAVSDYAAPVFDPDAFKSADSASSLMKALAAALPDGDTIRLDKIPAFIGTARNPLVDLAHVERFPVGAWAMHVPDDGEGKRPPNASKRAFSKARSKAREIAAGHERRFRWLEGRDELDAAFRTMVDLRVRRFDELGRPELLKEPMWLDFYRRLAAHEAGTMRPAIITLEADGEVIAALLGIGHGDTFHHLMMGTAMEPWASSMPGLQLIFDLIRDCPARGYGRFDLTIGDERYKKDVGAERRDLFETRIPVTLKGRALCAAWRAKVALRGYPRLFAFLKGLRSGRTAQNPVSEAG